MPEITVMLITFCIGLALLMAAFKLAAWLLRPIFRAIDTAFDRSTMDIEETGPRANGLQSQAMAGGQLMLTMVISVLLAIIVFLKHVFTFSNRYEERQRAFSKFCAGEINKDQRHRRRAYVSSRRYEEIDEEEDEADINPATGLPMKSALRDISGAKWGRVR